MKVRLLACLVALLLPALAGCGTIPAAARSSSAHLTSVPLMLDWYPNTDHAGIYSAIDRGYYRAAGLDVKPFVPSDPTTALKLVADNKVDFAISYEPDTIIARSQGLPVVAVMSLVTRPLNSIITLRSSGIATPKQLVGKKIGLTGLASDAAFLKAVLAHSGIKTKQVTQIDVGYNLVPALLSHQVNAVIGVYWSWEAVQIRQMGKPVNVFRLDRLGVPRYDELVVVTSETMLKTHPALVRAFVQATQRGLQYASAQPQVAASYILKAGKGLSRKLVVTSVGLLRGVFQQNGVPGEIVPSQWNAFAGWMYSQHLLARRVAGSSAATARFLKR